MRLQDLSVRAKVLVTGLGALLVVLGTATLLSFRYWEREQFALTADHALMAARAIRPLIEGALAHGQVGLVRERLDSLTTRPPAEGYRIVAFDGRVLLSSSPAEEGARRPGPGLPDPRDIPPEGLVVSGCGAPIVSAVVALSGVGGPGGRATLEFLLNEKRIGDTIRRGRTYGVVLTVLLGYARRRDWVSGYLRDAEAALGDSAAPRAAKVRLRQAGSQLAFVDRAGPMHNLPVVDQVMRRALALTVEAYELASRTPPPRPELGPPVANGGCTYCHYGIEEARAGRDSVSGRPLTHAGHVLEAGLSCDNCHAAGRAPPGIPDSLWIDTTRTDRGPRRRIR